MTILLGNSVLDNGLTYLQSMANRVALCSAQPTTFAGVSLVLLGSATPGPGGVFTAPVNATPNGRVVSSNAVTGSVTQGGTATYIAVVDDTDSVLLLTAGIDVPQAVLIGYAWQLATFNVTIGSGAILLLQPASLAVTTAPVLGAPALTITSITATAVLLAGQTGPGIGVNFPTGADAGQLVGAVTVTTNVPGTYIGVISLGGADGTRFSFSPTSSVTSAAYPCSLYVNITAIAAGTYHVTLTATP